MDYADGKLITKLIIYIGGDLASYIKRQKEKGGFLSEDKILNLFT